MKIDQVKKNGIDIKNVYAYYIDALEKNYAKLDI